jgi:hypothetical protein
VLNSKSQRTFKAFSETEAALTPDLSSVRMGEGGRLCWDKLFVAISNGGSHANGDASLVHDLLGLSNGVLAIVENAGREGGFRVAFQNGFR